jgi:hypothetical protein
MIAQAWAASLNYEKKAKTAMIINSTNIYKTNNRLSS